MILKSLMRGIAVVVLLLSAKAQAEEQINFATLDVTFDGTNSLAVTETISITSEGNIFKRGIIYAQRLYRPSILEATGIWPFRSFPKPPSEPQIKLVVRGITCDGLPVRYHTSTMGGDLRLLIGDKNLLSRGEHIYVLSYDLDGAVQTTQAGDEFEVLLGPWGPELRNASIIVRLPAWAKAPNVTLDAKMFSPEKRTFNPDSSLQIIRPDPNDPLAENALRIRVDRPLGPSEGPWARVKVSQPDMPN